MQDDCLDGRIIAEFLELPDHGLGRKNDAIQINHPNAVPETADTGFPGPGVHGEIHKGKDGEHKQKKRSSANQNPKQRARTSLRHVGECSTSL